MKSKEKLLALYKAVDKKFEEQFGFPVRGTTFSRVVDYLHAPKDSSSLAVTRILFGLAMLFDIPDERGGAVMDRRWGDPNACHFPLLPFLQAVSMPYMAIVYAAMWFGALGIMLGYKYRMSAAVFTACLWYLLLIEKSFWNNHSYLFGLVAFLLTFTQANSFWSLDVYLTPRKLKETIPYWNYFLLKYQFFILYFMAGLKKGTAEWLTGYSVQNLSEHWVFDPFKLFLTVSQTDYLIVHWFAFAFDLTVAFWMMWARTRHIAMIFCAMFHFMNSRLFRIGMFPWVCLATMPLFYPFNWPKVVKVFITEYYNKMQKEIRNLIGNYKSKKTCAYKINVNKDNIDERIDDNVEECHNDKECIMDEKQEERKDIETEISNERDIGTETEESNKDPEDNDKIAFCDELACTTNSKHNDEDGKSKRLTIYLIIIYALLQLFLPYSHFITKGYNNWTNGLYGYSWDMMVHTWLTDSIVVKIVDNDMKRDFFVDPFAFTPNDRWSRHGDMVYQYAHCLKRNLEEASDRKSNGNILKNVSIYIDVWCSMNGRFTQRMFDSKVDLLKSSWSPFKRTSYLMPLLDEALGWRTVLDDIRNEVHSWSNYTDVIFFADFPGYDLEKYIPSELNNVTLTVLEGKVAFEPDMTAFHDGLSYQLTDGKQIKIDSGTFHKIINIGDAPAFFMYTFTNLTESKNEIENKMEGNKQKLPIGQELYKRFNNMLTFANLVFRNVFKLFFPDANVIKRII